MGSEWKTVTLGEVLGERGYIRGPFGSSLRRNELKENGIPVYEQQHAINHIRSFRFFIGSDKHRELARFTVKPKDLIISCSGTVGRISIIADDDPIGIISQALLILRPDIRVITPTYLLYYLSSREGQYSITSVSSGSVQVNIAKRSIIENIEFLLPPIPKQKAITHILGSLDDKIELNRQMNQTLEKMAQAIFKSWFIDFDPVLDNALRAGNPIPESMRERAEIRRRRLDQNQPSPPAPLPEGEGCRSHYRGGYNFAGMVSTVRKLRKKQTPAEEIFWTIVRNRNFMGLKFRRQHQLGDYIADFFCHKEKIVIELDGGIHNQKKKKDAKRDAYMRSIGLSVLRFPNKRIIEDPESVLTEILEYISPSPLGDGVVRESSSPSGRSGDEGVVRESSSPPGRGGGEGFMDEIHKLFPDSFEDSELGETPKGWEVATVSALLEINPRLVLPKGTIAAYVDMKALPTSGFSVTGVIRKEFKGGSKFQQYDVLLARITPCLENGKTGLVDFLDVGQVGFGSTEFIVLRGKNHISKEFIYCLARDGQFRRNCISNMVGSSGRQRVQNACFDHYKLAIASEPILNAFAEYSRTSFEKITENSRELFLLSKLRDTLLPKLISGELPIPDVEKLAKHLKQGNHGGLPLRGR